MWRLSCVCVEACSDYYKVVISLDVISTEELILLVAAEISQKYYRDFHGSVCVCAHVTEWVGVIVKDRGPAYPTHSHAQCFHFRPPPSGRLHFFLY